MLSLSHLRLLVQTLEEGVQQVENSALNVVEVLLQWLQVFSEVVRCLFECLPHAIGPRRLEIALVLLRNELILPKSALSSVAASPARNNASSLAFLSTPLSRQRSVVC